MIREKVAPAGTWPDKARRAVRADMTPTDKSAIADWV